MSDEAAPDRDQQKLEATITKRFVDVFSKKADVVQRKYSERPSDFVLQDKEKAILMKINNGGLLEGLLAGMVSLFALRKMRGALLQKAYEKGRQCGSNNVIQQTAQQRSQLSNSPFHKNPGESTSNETQPRPGFIITTMGWTVDLFVSLFVAGSVSTYRFDLNTIANELSQIPLFPGNSAVSREFCPDAVHMLNQLREESKRDGAIQKSLVDPHSNVLKAVVNFSKNCERRNKYEDILRKEKGVSKDYRVAIPEPGVPVGVDGDSSSDDTGSLASGWTEQDSFSFDSETNTSKWADGFVEDQEEDSRK